MQERRQNVRVRPAQDYDVKVDYEDGLVKVQLSIIDVAVGGVGLVVDDLFTKSPLGAQLRLSVSLPGYKRFETMGSLRHSTGEVGGRCGIHFSALTDEQQTALSRVVSELLERGYSA